MTAARAVDKLWQTSTPMCCARRGLDGARADGGRGPRRSAPARRAHPRAGRRSATAIAPRAGTPGSARSSWPSPSCARAATSRASWSRAGAPSRRWSRSSRRPTSTASRPARSTGWSSSWGWRHVQGPGLAAVPRPGRAGQGLPGAAAGGRLPVPVVGRQGREGPRAGRGAPQALVIAYGVHEAGRREVIGLDVGEAETEAFWREFLRSLAGPRPGRASSWSSPTPTGPQGRDRPGARLPLAALHRPLPARHARPRRQGPAAAGVGRHPPDLRRHLSRRGALSGLARSLTSSRARAPKVARLLEEAEPDLLAFYGFPAEHRSKLRSTNPLGAGQPRDRPALRRGRHLPQRRRAAAAGRELLIEQNDEWLVGRRYLSEASMAKVLAIGHPERSGPQPAPRRSAHLTMSLSRPLSYRRSSATPQNAT